MKSFSIVSAGRIAAALVAVVWLAGCAGNGAALGVKSDGITRNDLDYMAAVQNAARSKGVRVVWINPPPELGKRYLREVK